RVTITFTKPRKPAPTSTPSTTGFNYAQWSSRKERDLYAADPASGGSTKGTHSADPADCRFFQGCSVVDPLLLEAGEAIALARHLYPAGEQSCRGEQQA